MYPQETKLDPLSTELVLWALCVGMQPKQQLRSDQTRIGHSIGLMFQIVDDLIDLAHAHRIVLGKQLGKMLRQEKQRIPVSLVLKEPKQQVD